MKSILWSTVLLLTAQVLPAQASLVRDAALNAACEGNIEVVVYRGMGAALDFTGIEYVVQRAWLGDPSKLTLDTDSPMEQGATSVIYLRAIDELSFDGLPATNRTVLITRLAGPAGPRVCQFPISYSNDDPDYTSLRLNDGISPQLVDNAQVTASSQINIDHVETGINLNAVALGAESPVVQRINSFVRKVRDGQSPLSAAQELEIRWTLIIELEEQGATADSYLESVFSQR